MTDRFFDYLKEQDVKIYRNCNISRYSTIGIGGHATLILPQTPDSFVFTLDYLREEKIEYKVVGRASNILFPDKDVESVIIKTTNLNRFFVTDRLLYTECGASFSKTINELANLGYGGFESLYCIPGTVGGMIYQNAGAYGKAISDNLVDALVYFDGEIKRVDRDELSFAYRSSSLSKSGGILLSARFILNESQPDSIISSLLKVRERRNKNQPTDKRSLGSIFKRTDGIPISMLIDKAGLKGYKIGGAEISKKHAGFIINNGGATASDVIALINLIKSTLYYRYGIIPELEIEILK